MVGLVLADAAAVRDLIARRWLAQEEADARIGAVVLHPHQTDAVGRIRAITREFGGALLCDAVGLGKTYVALAIARQFARPLVVAPASLRQMWRAASLATRVPVTFLTTESLSTKDPPDSTHDLVIVDEAHRFRNRATVRYARIVTLTRDAPVLLLSATPIHNRRDDLLALLELFLGSAARALTESETARIVVRRDCLGLTRGPRMPAVRPPIRITIGDDRDRLARILELPPPLPPADGSTAPALTAITLLRLWASSDAALRAGLRSRLARAAALRAALESGRHPTEAELRTWVCADGAVQLGFADLLCAKHLADTQDLAVALAAHESAIRALHDGMIGASMLDAARVAALLDIRGRHPGAKVVAFTQFAETATSFYRELKACGGVGLLTGSGGRIASGRISRRETIERFAPAANGAPPPLQSAAIDLLLTTDVLSEGVNLQDASVIVHLDLPWTAAALEQRVGRLARLGSKHREVFVYALDPPASAEELVRAEGIIRAKSGIAADAMGSSRIPSLFPSAHVASRSAVEEREEIRRILELWLSDREPPAPGSGPRYAGVMAGMSGFVALVSLDGRSELLADDGSGISTDPRAVRRVLADASGPSIPCFPELFAQAEKKLIAWWDSETARRDAGCAVGGNDPLRRTLFAQLAAIVHGLPRHEQQRQASRIAKIRSHLEGRLSAGVERDLHELGRITLAADRWLQRAEMILRGRDRTPPVTDPGITIRALLLYRRLGRRS